MVLLKMGHHLLSILLLAGFWVYPTLADFGSHDLFTSLAQLRELWINERTVVDQMKNLIVKLESSSQSDNLTSVLKE